MSVQHSATGEADAEGRQAGSSTTWHAEKRQQLVAPAER
jgi:hypothetical protein